MLPSQPMLGPTIGRYLPDDPWCGLVGAPETFIGWASCPGATWLPPLVPSVGLTVFLCLLFSLWLIAVCDPLRRWFLGPARAPVTPSGRRPGTRERERAARRSSRQPPEAP